MIASRILLLIILPLSVFAEGVSWNLGIVSNIGQGEQVGQDYDYLENFLNGSISSGPWYVDLRFEYSHPPEYGYQFTGVERGLLRYTSDTWVLEAGDISAVFGRGLALDLYEDQAIDFDNQIRGLFFSTTLFEDHELDFLVGSNSGYRFYSPSSDLREPDGEAAYDLSGLEATFNGASGNWFVAPYLIGSQVKSKYSWTGIDSTIGGFAIDTVTQTMHAIQGGWGQSLYGDSWDLYLEYNHTWKTFDYPLVEQSIIQTDHGLILENSDPEYKAQGQALNLQVNWFPEWFTIMFEYKRYLNGPEVTSDKRNPLLLASKPLPWQLGPTGIRQHDISLLGNVTHPVDYGDELGWNLELRRTMNEWWSLSLNAAQISQARDSRDLDRPAGFWPTQDITSNPWQEYFVELEYAGDALSNRMFIAYTHSVLSGLVGAELIEHLTLVPAYISWHPNDDMVLSSVVEFQHSNVSSQIYGGDPVHGHDYLSSHVIGSVDLKHKYSASIIWDKSDDPNLNNGSTGNQDWISGELSIKPFDGLWVRTSYGKEKGGVRCTGGVCRVLNPFEGFRMSVEWRL